MEKAIRREPVSLVNPIGFAEVQRTEVAKRLDMLQGKTIGLLDNAKTHGEVVLEEIKQYLESKGAICSIFVLKPNRSNPLPRELIERLARADAVVGAVAD